MRGKRAPSAARALYPLAPPTGLNPPTPLSGTSILPTDSAEDPNKRITQGDANLNFHGRVVTDINMPVVATRNSKMTARVDVIDCPELELELPTRHKPVKNEFLKKLHAEVHKCIYMHLERTLPAEDVTHTL